MDNSRYVVIGAGLAGAATAWQLARRGHEVTVLERSAPANPAGSSHGSARIFRYAYPDVFYAGLAVRARAEWDELEQCSGQRLIRPTGALDFGSDRDPSLLAAVLGQAGVAHELVAKADAQARWPMFSFGTDVLWHEAAGVIDAELAVLTMLRQAEAAGAKVEPDWPAASVGKAGAAYRVTAADGRAVGAERVIVSAGGWLPDLLGSLGLPAAFRGAFPALRVMQENVYHFPYRDGASAAGAWPSFIHGEPGMQTYGLPGGRDAGFRGQKVAEYNGGRPIGTASAQTGVIDSRNRERVIGYVRRTLPGLVPEPYAETTCLFTNTPTEDFVIDGAGGITVVSPCSGHGAKFAPLIGAIAADAADGSGTAPDRFLVRGAR